MCGLRPRLCRGTSEKVLHVHRREVASSHRSRTHRGAALGCGVLHGCTAQGRGVQQGSVSENHAQTHALGSRA